MKKAFSMIELIIVIVIVGILAITILPRFEDNKLREAADEIISNIRYAQHLAMSDNKFDTYNKDWHISLWQVFFALSSTGNKDIVHTIYTDMDNYGNADKGEIAIDPSTHNNMTGDPKYSGYINAMNLTKKFAIKEYNICGYNDTKRIYFDSLGRVYIPKSGLIDAEDRFADLINKDCNITFTDKNNKKLILTLTKETGYVYVASIDE